MLTGACSMCTFLCSRLPTSSEERFRLPGVSWSIAPNSSCASSVSCVDSDPFTLCAGVGRVVAVELTELMMLEDRSVVMGENREGLWGVCGWKDIVGDLSR